jgi:hypothetical protein
LPEWLARKNKCSVPEWTILMRIWFSLGKVASDYWIRIEESGI